MLNLTIRVGIVVILLVGACRGRREISQPGYILGPTADIVRLQHADVTAIDIDAAVLAEATKASILVVTEKQDGKREFCSGSLIGGRNAGDLPRIVTNHHCFAKKIAGTNRSLPNLLAGACDKTSVYFDFSMEDKPLTRMCQKNSLITHFEADLAFFTLDEELPAGYEPFQIWEGEVPPDRKAFIIHHPSAKESGEGEEGEEMLQGTGAYFPKKAITVKDCKVLGRFEENLWRENFNLPFGLRHTCDLVQGSSGSGLIDATSGKLLGVNWGGITFTINGRERKDNVASSAQFLREFVDSYGISAPPLPPKKKRMPWDKDFSSSCGHIAGAKAVPHELLLLVLLMPLMAVGFQYRR